MVCFCDILCSFHIIAGEDRWFPVPRETSPGLPGRQVHAVPEVRRRQVRLAHRLRQRVPAPHQVHRGEGLQPPDAHLRLPGECSRVVCDQLIMSY